MEAVNDLTLKCLKVGTASPSEEGARWRGKGNVRFTLLLALAAAIAALASTYGITYDYRYLRAAFLSGVPGGQYHALATRLLEFEQILPIREYESFAADVKKRWKS